MTVSINNAGQMNLSNLVTQLGATKDKEELRARTNPQGGGTTLYVKSETSNPFIRGTKLEDRRERQNEARHEIGQALFRQFGPAIGDQVMNNMSGFFDGRGKVTAGDARAVLAEAEAQAMETRKAEVADIASLLDPQGHPAASALFFAHCRNEFNAESYVFVQKVKDYQDLPYTTPAEIQVKQDSAATICAQFGKDGVSELNISSEKNSAMKMDHFDGTSEAAANTFFDASVTEVTALLMRDPLQRFQRSDAAKNYINNG